MIIEKGVPCKIEYSVYTDGDVLVDSNVDQDPLEFTPGENQLLPKLEMALIGKQTGDELSIELTPEDAYGPIKDEGFQTVPTESIPEGYREIGAVLGLQDKDKSENVFQAKVHAIDGDEATLDLNHPLAGKKLRFDIKVL